jgi:hypothetical protein
VEEPTITKSKKGTAGVQSPTNSMIIVVFDVKGIVHHGFVSPNTMVNSYVYCDVLRHMRENVV